MQPCKNTYECRRDRIVEHIHLYTSQAVDRGENPNYRAFVFLREWTTMSKELIQQLEELNDKNESIYMTHEGNMPCPHCLEKGIRRLNTKMRLVKHGKITVVPEVKKRPAPLLVY